MIDQIEHLGMPTAVEAQNLNRSQLDDRLPTRQLSHDRANHSTMRNWQRVVSSRISARRPQSQHAFQAALDATGKAGPALARGIGVARRESIGVPSRELVGITFANLIRGESFEQAEVNFGEFIDRDNRRRVARYDSRAFRSTNQWTRKNAREISAAPAMRLDRPARKAHLRTPELRQRHVGAAMIPDARLAFGLAVANQDQPRAATLALDHLAATVRRRNHSPSNSGFITRPVSSLGWK